MSNEGVGFLVGASFIWIDFPMPFKTHQAKPPRSGILSFSWRLILMEIDLCNLLVTKKHVENAIGCGRSYRDRIPVKGFADRVGFSSVFHMAFHVHFSDDIADVIFD